jgi:thiamine-monophosphate kinase
VAVPNLGSGTGARRGQPPDAPRSRLRGEPAAIERVRALLPGPPRGEIWIGDDAAVVAGAKRLLLTTDLSVAGVHADLDLIGLDDLGWRAVAGAVSDIAAMGGRPGPVLVAVAGPPSVDLELLYGGIAAACAEHGSPVVGGDLSTADQLVVAVSVTGAVPAGRPVLRSGAGGGDRIFVTGPLGAAAAGLRILRRHAGRRGAVDGGPGGTDGEDDGERAAVRAHRRPVARLAHGEAARRAGARAMIDVSDGLGADLAHLADASGVGVRLERVPVASAATEEEALGGGEDYELIIATPDPDGLVESFAASGLEPPLEIGHCTGDRAERLLRGRPLEPTGWEHPWG